MNKLVKKIPLPMASLGLAFSTLGNLFANTPNIRYVFGIISGLIVTLLIVKIFSNIDDFKKEMQNPLVATSIGTLSMATINLTTYIYIFIPNIATAIWFSGIAMHICLLLYVTKKFILKFDINKVFATYFIPYVGLSTASVSARVIGFVTVGKLLFYVGLIAYLILLPIILYRIIKIKNIDSAVVPTNAIIASPASLLLVGYINSFANYASIYMVIFLTTLSLTMYLAVIFSLHKMLKKDFLPTYSSFTFPFAISALATRQASVFFADTFIFANININLVLYYIYNIQLIFATLMVLYVLVKYINFIFDNKNESVATK